MDHVDNIKTFGKYQFVAVNLVNSPKYGPGEINIYTVVDHQMALDRNVDTMSSRIDVLEVAANGLIVGNSAAVLTDLLSALDSKLSTALSALSDRIENTNANLAPYAKIADSVRGPPQRSHTDTDFSMNVVFNGVPEDRDPSKWRAQVDEIVQFMVGRPVEISDMIRIGGRFQEGRTRPVLLKLSSV